VPRDPDQAAAEGFLRQGGLAVKILGLFQGQFNPTASVMVSQLVAGNTKQPGSKTALPAETGNGLKGGEEGLGRQIFSLLHMTRARQVVAIDAGQVAMV